VQLGFYSPGRVAVGRRIRFSVLAAVVIASLHPATAEEPATLAVFDFASQEPADGRNLADALRLKIRRRFERAGQDRQVLSYLELCDQWRQPPVVPAELDTKQVALIVRRLGCDSAIWGRIQRRELTVQSHVHFLQLADRHGGGRSWSRRFVAKGQRWKSRLARQIADEIVADKHKPATASAPATAGTAVVGRNILPNGDFERGGAHPVGWDRLDGLCTFWVRRPGGKGRCIKLNTDVLQRQAWQWWTKWRAGAPPQQAPEPLPTKPPYYDTVAGVEGVHYYSDYLPIKPGRRYRLACWQKAAVGSNSKIFVKGYALLPTAKSDKPVRREVWRTYLKCNNTTGDWQEFALTFTVRKDFKPVVKYAPDGKRRSYPVRLRWVRVILYAYWPPGQYYFDDVKLEELVQGRSADEDGDQHVKPQAHPGHGGENRDKKQQGG